MSLKKKKYLIKIRFQSSGHYLYKYYYYYYYAKLSNDYFYPKIIKISQMITITFSTKTC